MPLPGHLDVINPSNELRLQKVSSSQMHLDVREWQRFYGERVQGHRPLVQGFIAYVEKCLELGVVPVFEERHLAQLLNIPYAELSRLINAVNGRYRNFHIPKRGGGSRQISVPVPQLLSAQRWMLRNILQSRGVNEYAHGGVQGRSALTNAACHLDQKCVLNMDLASFFGTVKFAVGIRIFQQFGYSDKVSQSLARLCFEQGCLPQGAPTSTALANFACSTLDTRLGKLAEAYSLTYTRYVDDMTFSGSNIAIGFQERVRDIVEDCGFLVNGAKTRLARGKSPKYVTGLSVGGRTLRIPRQFKRVLRNEAFQLCKRGLEQHAAATDSRNPFMIDVILGRLAYWKQVEPDSEAANKFFKMVKEYRMPHLETSIELAEPRRVPTLVLPELVLQDFVNQTS